MHLSMQSWGSFTSNPHNILSKPLPAFPYNQISDRIENIVGKGEIARYEQFLLFPLCFQKLSVLDASK